MDAIREMSTNPREKLEINNLDMEMLHVKMSTVSQDLHEWTNRSAELLKSQRELLQLVQRAAEIVRSSAHGVRDYPVSVMQTVSERIEESARKCEASANEAQKKFAVTQKLIEITDETLFKNILFAAICASIGTATALSLAVWIFW